MKTNHKYALLSLVTAVATVGISLGALSFAQTVSPVSCSTATPTVSANQAAVFVAAGGNGTFSWSGTNLNVTNSVGSQFAVSFPNPGVYTIGVTSGGLSGNCTLTVVAATSGALTCSPASQTITLGQTATFAATGGNGTFTWSSPDLTITNANGSGFSASFASAGLRTVTVTSGSDTAVCAVNVLPNAGGGTVVPPVVTPGLPATGGGFGQ
jgi:hypothetical protein